jgi:hypothetical protein
MKGANPVSRNSELSSVTSMRTKELQSASALRSVSTVYVIAGRFFDLNSINL